MFSGCRIFSTPPTGTRRWNCWKRQVFRVFRHLKCGMVGMKTDSTDRTIAFYRRKRRCWTWTAGCRTATGAATPTGPRTPRFRCCSPGSTTRPTRRDVSATGTRLAARRLRTHNNRHGYDVTDRAVGRRRVRRAPYWKRPTRGLWDECFDGVFQSVGTRFKWAAGPRLNMIGTEYPLLIVWFVNTSSAAKSTIVTRVFTNGKYKKQTSTKSRNYS